MESLDYFKKWTTKIESFNLMGLDDDIEAGIKKLKQSEALEKYLSKILRSLSSELKNFNINSDQCIQVWKITMCIIKHIQVADHDLNSIYFIVEYMLNYRMYDQANEIFDFLISNNVVELYAKKYKAIADLWNKHATEILMKLKIKFTDACYMIFLKVIKQYCTFSTLVSDNHSEYIFTSIKICLEWIKTIQDSNKKNSSILCVDFLCTIFSHISTLNLYIPESKSIKICFKLSWIIQHTLVSLLKLQDFSNIYKFLSSGSSVLINLSISQPEDCNIMFIQKHLILLDIIIKSQNDLDVSAIDAINNYISFMESLEQQTSEDTLCFQALFFTIIHELLYFWNYNDSNNTNFIIEHVNVFNNFVRCVAKNVSLTKVTCCKGKCSMKNDLYNAILMKCKFTSMIIRKSSKFSSNVSNIANDLVTELTMEVKDLKEANCSLWNNVWLSMKRLIHNFCVYCENDDAERSIEIYCLLCSGIVYLEDKSNDYKSSLALGLYRIVCIYYKLKQFDKAVAAIPFWALYRLEDDNKCFRMWRRIKEDNKELYGELTMLSCLKNNLTFVEMLGLNIKLSDFNLAYYCLQEIEGLAVSTQDMSDSIMCILNEMENLDEDFRQEYARGVMLMAKHLTEIQSRKSIKAYIDKAKAMVLELDDSIEKTCLVNNLNFCSFMDSLNENIRISEQETDMIKKLITNTKKVTIDNEEITEDIIIPSFEVTNVRHDEKLMNQLKQVQDQWRKCFLDHLDEMIQTWKPIYTLDLIMLSGEYSKLYKYQSCEILAWKMALKLADALNNSSKYIKIVGNLLSARFIRNDWLDKAKEHVTVLKKSNDLKDILVVTMFQLELANYYFKINQKNDAIALLHEVHQVKSINVSSHIQYFLRIMNITLNNYHLFKSDVIHIEYSEDIVLILYGMVNLYAILRSNFNKVDANECWPYFFSLLFDLMTESALNLDSLINREALQHLKQQLEFSQRLACTLRLGTFIKILSTLDLQKTQLNDCEIKLSALERLLDIDNEQPKQPMKPKMVTRQIVDKPTLTIRDTNHVRQREGSIFPQFPIVNYTKPSFMCHKSTCDCYKCKNSVYQNLVFASISLRAQYYMMKNNHEVALQYFMGAYKIRKMFAGSEFRHIKIRNNNMAFKSFWYTQESLADWLNFLLNFSDFLKSVGDSESAVNIAKEGINICREHRMEPHAIYRKFLIHLRETLDIIEDDVTVSVITNVSDLEDDVISDDISEPVCSPSRFLYTGDLIQIDKRVIYPKHNRRKKTQNVCEPTRTTIKTKLEIYVDEPEVSSNSKDNDEIQESKEKRAIENNIVRRSQRTRKIINYSESPRQEKEITATVQLLNKLQLKEKYKSTKLSEKNLQIINESEEDIFKDSVEIPKSKQMLNFNSSEEEATDIRSIRRNKLCEKKANENSKVKEMAKLFKDLIINDTKSKMTAEKELKVEDKKKQNSRKQSSSTDIKTVESKNNLNDEEVPKIDEIQKEQKVFRKYTRKNKITKCSNLEAPISDKTICSEKCTASLKSTFHSSTQSKDDSKINVLTNAAVQISPKKLINNENEDCTANIASNYQKPKNSRSKK